jgi:hypothetical protein
MYFRCAQIWQVWAEKRQWRSFLTFSTFLLLCIYLQLFEVP